VPHVLTSNYALFPVEHICGFHVILTLSTIIVNWLVCVVERGCVVSCRN